MSDIPIDPNSPAGLFLSGMSPEARTELLRIAQERHESKIAFKPSFRARLNAARMKAREQTGNVTHAVAKPVKKVIYGVGHVIHDFFAWLTRKYYRMRMNHPHVAKFIDICVGFTIGFMSFIIAYTIIMMGLVMILVLFGV